MPRDIVLAKLVQPPLPAGYLSRSRVVEAFSCAASQQLTCVVAPVGYGKTLALAEFAQAARQKSIAVAWLSADGQDNDPARFWAHAAASLEGALGVSFAIEPNGCPESAVVSLCNQLHAHLGDRGGVLIVDGFENIESEEVENAFLQFCAYVPPRFSVVLAANALSRRMEMEAYRLGQVQLSSYDLALTEEETRIVLEGALGGAVEGAQLHEVFALTEGWPQGVVLAGRALASAGHHAEPSPFDGSNRLVKRYFESQVLARIPIELVSFLLELSVFERFSRGLCDAVFGSRNTQALFNETVRRSLFIVPCDDRDEWFRFNRLFVDWLRNGMLQLRIETIREICARASEWFHDHGCGDEAAKYLLLASDFDYVANLTEATCSLSRDDRQTHYLLWQCRIPSAEFADSPLLCMLCAWSGITNARVADAQVWIDRFERSMEAAANERCLDPSIVEFSSKCLKMKCTAMSGDGNAALAQCDELLNSGYSIKPSLMSMIYQSLGEAYERIGDMAQAQEIYLQAQASASVDATKHQLLFNAFNYAEVQYCFGELNEAQEGCEKLLKTCPSDFAIYGATCALLARVLLERNDLDRAAVLVERSLKRTSHYRHIDMYLEAKIAQAGLLASTGNLSASYEAIVEGILHGEQKGVPRAVLPYAYFMQACIAARRGNVRDLCIIERKFAVCICEGDEYCQMLLSFVRAFIERERGSASLAADMFGGIATTAQQKRFVWVAVRALVAEILALLKAGDEPRASARLHDVLVLASRHGFVRSLLDAGMPLRDLLRSYSATRKAGASVRAYVKSLLIEFEKELPAAASGIGDASLFANDGPDPLTPRELEVLKLLNLGMSRQEMAEVLCISVNTAKKHLANIYSKLGAGTREEALQKYSAHKDGER